MKWPEHEKAPDTAHQLWSHAGSAKVVAADSVDGGSIAENASGFNLLQDFRSIQIAGKDKNGTSTIDLVPSAICRGRRQAARVHRIHQGSQNVRMGFLYLIEQHDRPRVGPEFVGQLCAFAVPDVSLRRPDQLADAMALLILRHVESQIGVRGTVSQSPP
jgi:hypothetical protein